MAYSQAFQSPLTKASTSKPSYSSFPIDHDLMNPHFEAYRLVQQEDSSHFQSSHHLPSLPLSLKEVYDFGLDPSSQKKTLGYKEAKERSSHTFLVPARSPTQNGPVAAYIDKNGFVVLLTLAPTTNGHRKVTGHPVHHLDLSSRQEGDLHRALPFLISISPTHWLASDGAGKLDVLTIQAVGQQPRWIRNKVKRWVLREAPGSALVPFKIVDAQVDVGGGKVEALLQTASRKEDGKIKARSFGGLGFPDSSASCGVDSSTKVVFDVRLVALNINDEMDASEGEQNSRPLTVQWTVTGEEPLTYAKVDPIHGQHLLCAESGFSPRQEANDPTQAPTASTQPSPGVKPEAPSTLSKHSHFRPRRSTQYSWAQTSDTLTIAFSLPRFIEKSNIRVHFSIKGLSLTLADQQGPRIVELHKDDNAEEQVEDSLEHTAKLLRSGRYVSRSTWAEIDPTGSVWTWERAAGKPMGVLTLHLEKKHEGTRWMQVFARKSSGANVGQKELSRWEQVSKKTNLSFREARERAEKVRRGETEEVGDVQLEGMNKDEKEEAEKDDLLRTRKAEESDCDDDDVPETLDPSELLNMLEGMEKYTVDEEAMEVTTSQPYEVKRTGLGPEVGSGNASLLRDGLEEEDDSVGQRITVSWVRETASGIAVERPSIDAFEDRSILALPAGSDEASLIIKHDLDGAVFLPPSPTDKSRRWKHIDQIPALAFVLASKRDAHRVFIHRPPSREGYSSAVLAFESAPQISGASGAGAGNLFVYYAGGRGNYGRSRVIRLGNESSGALLGVAVMSEGLVLCLCERSLLILEGIL